MAPTEYLSVALIFAAFGYLIYFVSINVVEDYAIIIRSGYDLYRFDLLRQLNLPIPNSLYHEKKLWRNISEFLVVGEKYGLDPKIFVYHLSKENAQEERSPDSETNKEPSIA